MSKLTRRDFLRLSTVAAAGALAAACAKTEAPTATPEAKAAAPTATPKPAEPTATPEPAAKPWPRGDVPRNRIYVQMFQGGGGQYSDTGISGPWASGFCHQCGYASGLEGLAYFSAHGNKHYPWLAESHEYNDDATELTVYIRKGAEWSDGTPFTAHDVAFTVNTLIAKAPDLRDSSAVAKFVKEAVVVDDHTVKLTFNEPNWRFFFTYFTFRFDRGVYMVPKHIYETVEGDYREFMFQDFEKGWPVVTGPYQITRDETQHKYFDLRYEWWADKIGLMRMPRVERIIMLPFSEHTLAAELIINNELDQGPEFPPTTIRSIIESAPHCITHTGREKPYGYVDWWPLSLMFNTLEKPYDDARVRWAMALAIDQQQLVDIGQIGAGQVTSVPYPFYPPLMKYIEGAKDIIDQYNVLEVNLQKSADLMMEAGFTKDSAGFWVDAEGNRPDANIYAAETFFSDIAPLAAEQLRTAGFDATHVMPPDVWAAKDDGRARLHMWGHGGSIADPFYTLNMYHIDKVRPTGESCGDNRPRWGNQAFSDIVDEMNGTPMEDPKILDQFRAAIEIWLRELPEVPLIQYYHRIPYNTNYWTNWPTEENPYINGAQRHLTFPLLLWNLEPTQ